MTGTPSTTSVGPTWASNMPLGQNCRSTSGSVDRSTSGSTPPAAWGTGASPLAWPPSTAIAAWSAMLVFGCEPLLLPYAAERQIARATGSYRRAARRPARAVKPTTRVAGLAALAAVAGLAALAAVAGLAGLRAAPPTPQRKPTLTGSATSRFAT